jgi:hypothetical protein
MNRGNDQNALIARRAQGIDSGLHPESDFENTSTLFICAGNKSGGAREEAALLPTREARQYV